MRIDSHQHFWEINDTDYVWMGPEHAVIKKDFLPSDLQPLLHDAELDGCVAVQARQKIEETEWLLKLAEDNPFIKGVVGWIPHAENAGAPYLEQYAAHEKCVGMRHVVHDEPDDDFILGKAFNEGVAALKNTGLVYDILIFAKHLPQTLKFVDQHPEQAFVVDHIAKPTIAADSFDSDWAKYIGDLAQREHVSCKLSGMVTEVRDDTWTAETLKPYFDVILEAFGPERMLYGSDWPVCLLRSEYSSWVEAVKTLTSPLSASEQTAIWGGTAQRIYNLK